MTTGFDPTAAIGKLEAFLKSQEKSSKEGGPRGWVSTLIIIVVGVAAIAVWAWVSQRQGRELAELRHAKEKAKIEADQAAMRIGVARSNAVVAQRAKDFEVAQEQLRRLEADTRAAEARYEANRRAIDRIQSWNDVAGSR